MVKSKLYICRDYHLQPSEIDRFPYYEFELILEEIKQIHAEQEKENERQQKEHEQMNRRMNPNSMMRNINTQMPKVTMPSMPKVNIPRF